MALISIDEWLDRYGCELNAERTADSNTPPNLSFTVLVERRSQLRLTRAGTVRTQLALRPVPAVK